MEFSNLKMKRMRWVVVLTLLAGMLVLFFASMIQHQQKLAELEQYRQELTSELDGVMRQQHALNIQLKDVGSTSMLDSTVRAEDFVKPGELRFTIDNSEGVLEMYTEEEWEILMNERDLGLY